MKQTLILGPNEEQASSSQSSYFEEELHLRNKQDTLLEKCSLQQSAPKKLGEWEQYTNVSSNQKFFRLSK